MFLTLLVVTFVIAVMPKSRPPYAAEFIELVRTGRNPEELSRKFGCTAQSIRNWVARDALDRGKPIDFLRSPVAAKVMKAYGLEPASP